LPPVEKREGHHYYENLDINKSYREYLKVWGTYGKKYIVYWTLLAI
jgi:hypothetical protein